MTNYLKKLTTIVLIFCIVISFNLFFYKKAGAFGFGGIITLPVLCSNGIMLIIGPPTPGTYLVTPTTKIYAFYKLITGTWLLGSAIPGGACVAPDLCFVCPPIPANIVTKVGTSN